MTSLDAPRQIPPLPAIRRWQFRWQSARWGLATVVALAALAAIPERTDTRPRPASRSDTALYGAVISRVAAGEPYYAAMGAEMRTRGYPLRSVFNWRLPTIYVLQGRWPLLALGLLLVSSAAVLFGTYLLFRHAHPLILIGALLLQSGAVGLAVSPLGRNMTELWAGICLALSVCAYGLHRPVLGALAAVAGLFIRELMAPYIVGCVLLALWHRRGRELAVWGVGGLAFALFFAWHVAASTGAMLPTDPAQPASWVQFGGLPFLLKVVGFNGWMLTAPSWVHALALGLLAGSVTAGPVHLRLAVGVFLVFFAVVGQPINGGWGMFTASAWALAYLSPALPQPRRGTRPQTHRAGERSNAGFRVVGRAEPVEH